MPNGVATPVIAWLPVTAAPRARLTRRATDRRRGGSAPTIRASRRISYPLSQLIVRSMPSRAAATAAVSSSSVLAGPPKAIRRAPAATAIRNSPPEATSTPSAAAAIARTTSGCPFAFIA